MRTAVIGANGFIGGALVRQLAAAGADVAALDVRRPDELPESSTFFELDVTAGTFALPDDTNAVFYLAQSSAYREFPQRAGDLFAVNVLGAVRAAEAACRAGAKFFLYASSGSVYAPSFESLPESAPLTAGDPYAVSKQTAENVLRLFDRHLATLSVRLFGVFGPKQTQMLPFVLRRRVESGEPIDLDRSRSASSDEAGLQVSFTYVDDVVAILLRLAEIALAGNRLPAVLNVANPEAHSIREFAEVVGNRLGKAPVFRKKDSQRSGDLVADVTRLRRIVDYEFTPFEHAIERVLE